MLDNVCRLAVGVIAIPNGSLPMLIGDPTTLLVWVSITETLLEFALVT
jgi:Na+/H+ antiporter NhaD/arsenite permease-like protein